MASSKISMVPKSFCESLISNKELNYLNYSSPAKPGSVVPVPSMLSIGNCLEMDEKEMGLFLRSISGVTTISPRLRHRAA